MHRANASTSLNLEHVGCCICGRTDAEPVGVGEDFEYRTSPDTFLAVQCPSCDLVYLDPRPKESDFGRIYPDDYHAFDFSPEQFGLVHRVRRRLEARRLVRYVGSVPSAARIIDVGCGDGFHLSLLAEFGQPTWTVEGVDVDERALDAARRRGLTVHAGHIEELQLDAGSYDVAIMIQTIEHVVDPPSVLSAIARILKPGGRLVIVTDNTGSLDYRLFRRRHWGGYHFPRHLNLFNKKSIDLVTRKSGLVPVSIETIVSPVNWVYSVRNLLDDYGAPRWLVDRFSLSSVVSLSGFTVFDMVHQLFGRGALLCATVTKAR
jgi:ubiquinone/menaquinone biosynthesis C-methylase UbiE